MNNKWSLRTQMKFRQNKKVTLIKKEREKRLKNNKKYHKLTKKMKKKKAIKLKSKLNMIARLQLNPVKKIRKYFGNLQKIILGVQFI